MEEVSKIYIDTPTGQTVDITNFECIRVIDRVIICDALFVNYSSHLNALIAWEKLTSDIKAGLQHITMMTDEECCHKFNELKGSKVIYEEE